MIFAVFLLSPQIARSATIEELRKSIEQKNQEIQKLEADIKKYRQELSTTQTRGKTLKEEIARLDREIKKINSNITLTERQVQKKELEISALGLDIQESERKLVSLRRGLAGLIQSLFEQDQTSLVAVMMRYGILSDFFRHIGYIDLLQNKIISSVETLQTIQRDLNKKKEASEARKEELADLSKLLRTRRSAQSSAKEDKNTILSLTKNQEQAYQKLLKSQEARREALEDEVRDIEIKIKIAIDPASLPSKGHGILGSPLPDVGLLSCWQGGGGFKNCLTQFFGYTSFAAAGAYAGNGHNGVDFRAENGTPVLAAETGTIQATGDTDIGCKRASYGKWILVKHSNNLTTLYAHLSAISVSQGQSIKRGERIGLSGQSGYATGPHLHFGLYASQAVSVEAIRSKVCGRLMTLPIAAINGYLNPLDYL
ncbi:MAG: peptidoglycan DD-metalloendopeptidase family protein [Candidatus Sungbacteria bacterium]|nr:peptidoglycan DD-metalloendopeptidase family protein [Candidatus Sungbacteria bacterium]